jgi:hypothetical protein
MTIPLVAMIAAGLLAAGCGGSGSSSTGEMPAGSASSPATTSAPGGSEAVPSEAQAAAAGDIPDNQVFLTYRDPGGGYSIRYPEGWARQGSGNDVTFSEKANVIHLAIAKGPAPSPASARRGIQQLRRADPTVRATAPQQLTIKGQPVVKTTYSRLSRPDPVTGKRLRLTIDRYEYGNRGRVAVLDLGTPVGVDNVDAYRMISESLTWR